MYPDLHYSFPKRQLLKEVTFVRIIKTNNEESVSKGFCTNKNYIHFINLLFIIFHYTGKI